jgi:hypothetical protein
MNEKGMSVNLQNSTKKYLTLALGIFLWLILPQTMKAQSLTATASSTQVSIGEVFSVDYTLDRSADHFEAPDFKGFVMASSGKSSNISMINGHVTFNVVYHYELVPRRTGTFTIAPAHAKVNGKSIYSNSLRISVSASGNNNIAGGIPPSGNDDDGQADVFIEMRINKKEAYVGEGIQVSCLVYVSNVQISSMLIRKSPLYTGFWTESVLRPNVSADRVVRNGRIYEVQMMKKDIIFPRQAGDFTIDPFELEISGDALSGFFGAPFSKRVETNTAKIHVKALPDVDRPDNFSGLTGKAAISVKTDRNKLKANEAFTYTVSIGGEGNLKAIQPFDLSLGKNTEIYSPKITDKLDFSDSNETGTRNFEYTVIPRQAGELKIPSLDFSYFDPVKKEYVSLHTQELSMEVGPADKSAELPQKKEQEDSGHNGLTLSPFSRWLLILGIPLVIVLLLITLRRNRNADQSQAGGAAVSAPPGEAATKEAFYHVTPSHNSLSSGGVPEELLRAASVHLEAGRDEAFFQKVEEALYTWLQSATSLSTADMTHESMRQALLKQNFPEEKADAFVKLIMQCELARYAASSAGIDKAALLQSAKELLLRNS